MVVTYSPDARGIKSIGQGGKFLLISMYKYKKTMFAILNFVGNVSFTDQNAKTNWKYNIKVTPKHISIK